jgi:hypothetical protein
MGQVTADFIAAEPDGSRWRIVLVEEGPWRDDDVDNQLRRVQGRLYDMLDVALDGGLWRLYPDSFQKPVTLQLDCYNVPEEKVRPWFGRFATGAGETPDYAKALRENKYVAGLSFELNCS